MKKTVFALALACSALCLSGCNTSETHDRASDHPAGNTQPEGETGEDARDKLGDDTNEQGKEAAGDYK